MDSIVEVVVRSGRLRKAQIAPTLSARAMIAPPWRIPSLVHCSADHVRVPTTSSASAVSGCMPRRPQNGMRPRSVVSRCEDELGIVFLRLRIVDIEMLCSQSTILRVPTGDEELCAHWRACRDRTRYPDPYEQPAGPRWGGAYASTRPEKGADLQPDRTRRLERHHASGPQRVHLLGRGCQAGDDSRAPHPPDPGGAGGGPAPALLLARVHAPRAHRQVVVAAAGSAPPPSAGPRARLQSIRDDEAHRRAVLKVAHSTFAPGRIAATLEQYWQHPRQTRRPAAGR